MLTANKILKEYNKGNITIKPFNKSLLNPNSYNVRLQDTLKVYRDRIDSMSNNTNYETVKIPKEGYILRPGILYIGATKEVIGSDKYISAIDGRSSIGRLGIQIHSTAGFGDIGFIGTYTLEISVIVPVTIYPDIAIGQVYFQKPNGKVDFLYNGRYQGQIDPTESRLYDNNVSEKYFYNPKDDDVQITPASILFTDEDE